MHHLSLIFFHDYIYLLHEILHDTFWSNLYLKASGNSVGLDAWDSLAGDLLDLFLLLRRPHGCAELDSAKLQQPTYQDSGWRLDGLQ